MADENEVFFTSVAKILLNQLKIKIVKYYKDFKKEKFVLEKVENDLYFAMQYISDVNFVTFGNGGIILEAMTTFLDLNNTADKALLHRFNNFVSINGNLLGISKKK